MDDWEALRGVPNDQLPRLTDAQVIMLGLSVLMASSHQVYDPDLAEELARRAKRGQEKEGV